MKKFISVIIGLLLLAVTFTMGWYVVDFIPRENAGFEKAVLKEPGSLEVGSDEYLFEVKEGEVDVSGELIDSILVGKNITVVYRNRTEGNLTPAFNLQCFNSYGMLLAEVKVKHSFGSKYNIGPGEVISENILLSKYPIKKILERSAVEPGEGADTVKWLLISNINSSLKGHK